MAADCKEGVYCYRGSGNDLLCPPEEIIDIDLIDFSWKCVQDQGQCPGGGGYFIGDCSGNSELTTPISTTSTTAGGPTTTGGATTTGGSDTTTAGDSGAPKAEGSMSMGVVLSSMAALIAYLQK